MKNQNGGKNSQVSVKKKGDSMLLIHKKVSVLCFKIHKKGREGIHSIFRNPQPLLKEKVTFLPETSLSLES